jgi:tetratricopeptide (TPR) repeat protein
MQTPFDRLLAEVSQQAQKEPLSAFGRLQECYNKSLTDMDVRHLGAFTANLGGSGLGRFDDAITFIETLLDHPALEQGGDTEHSLWRAIACLQRCAKREVPAAEAMAKGARNANERARVEALSAQMLAARGRAPEAIPMLEAALALIPDCDNEDNKVQIAQIVYGISAIAEQNLNVFQKLLSAASSVGYATQEDSEKWRNRHKSAYHRGNAHVMCGEPREALNQVQAMMKLEEEHAPDVVALERFFTAILACRAQILRGQFRVATGAYEAATDFARRVEDNQEKKLCDKALNELRPQFERYQQTLA